MKLNTIATNVMIMNLIDIESMTCLHNFDLIFILGSLDSLQKSQTKFSIKMKISDNFAKARMFFYYFEQIADTAKFLISSTVSLTKCFRIVSSFVLTIYEHYNDSKPFQDHTKMLCPSSALYQDRRISDRPTLLKRVT